MGWILLLVSHLYITTWALEWDFGDYCFRRGTREIPPLTSSDLNAVEQLVQVQILNRHGARTNFDVGPNSACNAYPHRFQCDPQVLDFQPTLSVEFIPTPDTGTCCAGCLLPLGWDQLQRTAQQLRKGYIGPGKTQLPEDLSLKRIYAYTTATERTRQSLQSILRVFFPQNTQTISVHSRVSEWELVEPAVGCDAFELLYKNANEQALAALRDTPTPVIPPLISHDDWDCLAAKACDGMEFPVSGITEENMRDMTNFTYQKAVLETNAIADFASAGMMGLVHSKLQERDQYSLVFWSGHDTSLMYFLSALGVWDELWVQYASAVSIETYKMKDSSDFPFGFRIVKNGETLRMPGCESDVCDLEILTTRLAKTGLSPIQFYRSCDVDDESELFALPPSSPPLLLWVIVPLSFASMMYIFWLWQFNKHYERIQ